MTVKQWFVVVIVLAAIGGLVAVRFIGTQDKESNSQPTLSNPMMARSVNEITAEPTEPTDIFTPDTAFIYCSVKLSNAPPDTEVKAQWIYVEGEADMSNHLLYESVGTFSGTRYLAFELTYDTPWPQGKYEVILYLNDEQQFVVPFEVR